MAGLETALAVAAMLVVAAGAAAFRFRTALFGFWRRLGQRRRRILAEDALKHILKRELAGRVATPASLAENLCVNPAAAAKLVARLDRQGLVNSGTDRLSLTPEGREHAVEVVRAHRLWERYLADEARMPVVGVHAEAERREHGRSSEDLDALDAAMGHPVTDPHGDPIPTVEGELVEPPTRPVTAWPLNTPAQIVHLEDEPPAIFARIAEAGLRPEQTVRVVERGAGRTVLRDGETRYELPPDVAANIFVTADGEEEAGPGDRRLTSLGPGQSATVYALEKGLQGLSRRRLLDLGLTPGVEITAEMSGVFRDPVAYRVRGSLIALRSDQAAYVMIESNGRERKDHG